MSNPRNIIQRSIQKRQAALLDFTARRKAFLISKEAMLRDIEEAREIWIRTLEQLPTQIFNK